MSLDCPKITRGLADSSKTEYKTRHERKTEWVEEKKKKERTRERENKNEEKKKVRSKRRHFTHYDDDFVVF